MQTILGLVAAGLGVALVPQCMSKLQRPDVRYLALDARGFEVETVALWQSENAGAGARPAHRRAAGRPSGVTQQRLAESDPSDGRRPAAA